MLVPKLRFKREDGTDYPEWEDWVLDSIGSFYGGLSGKTKEDFGKGNSKFVTYMNVYKNIFTMQEMLESVDISDNEKQNKVKYGDLLMTQSSETVEELGMSSVYLFYDEPYLNSFCFGLHLYNHALTYPMYIGYLMRSEAIRKQIMREGQGISRINLSPNRMKRMILSLPCLEEQQKIANFLSTVDEVIAQSEAEVANLQQQKKAAMQKIFSQEVRFKREDGTSYPEWNSKSFSDTFSSLNNNTFSRNMLSESGSVCNIHYGDIFVKYGEICDVQKENIPKVNDHIDTGKYDLLQDGDIILADTAEDETVGKATEILNVGTATVISGLHTMACRPNYKFAPMYLGYYINSPTYHNQLLPFMQGIKVTSIGRKNISETSIPLPCLEEQQKIADFLSTVDEVIAQSEAEVANLQHQKKAAMQKIFSQEVRFKREDGTSYPEWENVKFGSLIKEYRDRTSIENEDVLLSSAISGMFLNTELFGHQRGKSNIGYLKINYGTLILSAQNLHLGNANVNLRFEHGIISPAYKTYHITNCNLYFMAQWIKREKTNQFFYNATTVGASQCRRNVDWNALYKQSILIPHLEEQQKIADFLATYDEAISYAKQELDKWKELKKGLLQQMFA